MSTMDLHRPAAYDDFGSHNDLRYGRHTPGPDAYQARVADQDLYRGTRTPDPYHSLPRQRRRQPTDQWQHGHDEDMFYDPYSNNSHHSLPRQNQSHRQGTEMTEIKTNVFLI